jgi:hypothetical protein
MAHLRRFLLRLVTEGHVLTAHAAITGLLFARLAVTALLAGTPVTFPSFVAPALDTRVAAFTIAVSLPCGLAVSLTPGLKMDAGGLNDALKESARIGTGRSQHLRHGVIVAEIALAVVLLIGAPVS